MSDNQFEDNFPNPPKLSDTQPRRVKQPAVEMGDTMPAAAAQDTVPVEVPAAPAALPPEFPPAPPQAGRVAAPPPRKKRRSGWLLAVLGVLALILVAGLSGLGGYYSGIDMRLGAEGTQVSQAAQEQFNLALQDIDNNAYELARQRLEYVLRINPAYPGAVDKLADVLLELNTTATPTLVPTPTLTPTPDMRGVEELFTQAQQAVLNGEWRAAIDALNALRSADAQFHALEVDGLYFVAFRNLGSDLILKEANLEEGIYQLTLAERFGLLDAEAKALLNWSSLYIKGASFWELDWGQATYYFGQVAPYAPNLRDGSGMTAMQRYQEAIVKYIQKLFADKNWCEAKNQIEIALTMMPDNAELQAALVTATERCAAEKK